VTGASRCGGSHWDAAEGAPSPAGHEAQVRTAGSKSNPPTRHVTAGLTLVFTLRRGREDCRVQAAWLTGIRDDFPPVEDGRDLRQLEQAARHEPSLTISPTPGRTFPHEQMEGLPSQVPRCHVDPALPPSSCMLRWRATFHLSGKFFGRKQGAISSRPTFLGRNQILFPKHL